MACTARPALEPVVASTKLPPVECITPQLGRLQRRDVPIRESAMFACSLLAGSLSTCEIASECIKRARVSEYTVSKYIAGIVREPQWRVVQSSGDVRTYLGCISTCLQT